MKTKFMEAYEKFHAKLLELRELKSQITLAKSEVASADQRARDFLKAKDAEAQALLADAQQRAEELSRQAVLEADRMRSEPWKNLNILKGRMKKVAAFLRKQEDALRELQTQEMNEVNEAKVLYQAGFEAGSKLQRMYEAGAEAARETMLAAAVEDEQRIEDEMGGAPSLMDEPDPNNVAHAPGHE